MSLNDATDLENSSVSLSEFPTVGDFLVVDGKNVTGSGEATCP